jgi:nicotinamidase-related amidase
VVWVNWGLTEEEVDKMPPSMLRAFGAGGVATGQKDGDVYVGLGGDCGSREDVYEGKGRSVQAGRLLMRDQWNSDLYGPLKPIYEEGRGLEGGREDVWIHKNRMSALWSDKSDLGDFLEDQGIRSLVFSGVNTDQCVGGTLQDAFSKGFDCVLLRDAVGTSSPGFAQEGIEFNAGRSWGFVTGCGEFAKGVEGTVGGGTNVRGGEGK